MSCLSIIVIAWSHLPSFSYSNTLLEKHRRVKGITVIKIASVFVTNNVWVKMASMLLNMYCLMPYIVDTSKWWFIYINKGFEAYNNSLLTMEICANEKCISLKDESISSLMNYVYNNFVAKGNKNSVCQSLHEEYD